MKAITIIHIFNDDKFIDPAIKLFESVAPGISEYWVIKNNEACFQHVKSNLARKLTVSDEAIFVDFIKNINDDPENNPVVFFHALDQTKQKIALKLSDKVVKVWFIWGYDLYGNWPLFQKKILEKETKHYIHQTINKNKKDAIIFNDLSYWVFKNLSLFKNFLPSKVKHILRNNYDTLFIQASKKIDIVVPVVPTELEYVKKIGANAVYAPFTYGCLEDLLLDKLHQNVKQSKNILVGNSADYSNNHVDIFYKLSKFNLGDSKVYVPLSYSGTESYKAYVIKKGKELLGDNFIPLTDFMSLEKYNAILLSCGTLIFNHVRQQGVGNIITMGYLGARIYLNPKSPVYSYYKDLGLKVFDVNLLKGIEGIKPLNDEEHEFNKQLLWDLYSEKMVQQKIEKLFETVEIIKNKKCPNR